MCGKKAMQVSGTSSSRSFCLRRRVSLVWLLYGTNLCRKASIPGTLCGAFSNAKHGDFHVRQTQTGTNRRTAIPGTFCGHLKFEKQEKPSWGNADIDNLKLI